LHGAHIQAAASKEKLLPNLLGSEDSFHVQVAQPAGFLLRPGFPPPKVIKVTADFCGYGTAVLLAQFETDEFIFLQTMAAEQ